MKILLINTNYGGGAGIACRRLHQALLSHGVDSNLLVLDKVNAPAEEKVYSIEEIILNKQGRIYFTVLRFINRLLNKLPTLLDKKAYINGPTSLFRIDKLDIYKEADIVHLHWVPKIISYKHIFANKSKVFFWTLHDMNPFTGGNHYTFDFDAHKYKKLLAKNSERKKEFFKKSSITFVSPSVWLAKLAANSDVLNGFKVLNIPNCINTEVFKPLDKQLVREKLNIVSKNKKFILFAAEDPNDQRKGMHLLFDALTQIQHKSQICVLIIGKKVENLTFDFPVIQLGFIRNTSDLVNCYNSADFFVIPSVEDNLPNTVLESLACGTPVLGYNIGGMPDMVENNSTGLLSDIENQSEFIKNLDTFITLDDYTSFSENGRALVEKKFSEKTIVQQMLNEYKNALLKS